ncbi:MAG: hypothetical protein AB1416_12780 [Actinomycetota bacterium]
MSTAAPIAVVEPPAPPAGREPVVWSDRPGAGWSEFRVRRALFLASLTLQSHEARLRRGVLRLVEDADTR